MPKCCAPGGLFVGQEPHRRMTAAEIASITKRLGKVSRRKSRKTKPKEIMMNIKVSATVEKDGNLYVATCSALNVTSQGKSKKEALSNLREALQLSLDTDQQ